MGSSVGTAGDVNGDGYADVIVGAYYFDNGESYEGKAFVYLGSDEGTSSGAAWTAEANQASAFLGNWVGTAGDVNGDGYDDIIIGDEQYDNSVYNDGLALVWYGSATGLGENGTPENADWKVAGEGMTIVWGAR